MIVVTTEALNALDESIIVWARRVKDIAEATDTETYQGSMVATTKSCPLCLVYNPYLLPRTGEPMVCKGCPIRAKTGRSFCEDTPYKHFDSLVTTFNSHCLSVAESRPIAEPAAKAMLMFLEDLRDECTDGRSHA